jgi:glycogen debranching enzyme
VTEVIDVNDRYYILAGSSLADDRTLVMKDGETFGLFDHYGDIHPYGLGEQGLFHDGTRHLSACDLHLNGRRPLFLSSAVSPDNDTLTIDLSNPDITGPDGVLIPRGTIHLNRARLLWAGVWHERIVLENFGLSVVTLTVSVSFDADFVDIFEVRGTARARRGRFQPPQHRQAGRMVLSYRGLDQVLRSTDIAVSAGVPAAFEGSRATLLLTLPPRVGTDNALQIRCR